MKHLLWAQESEIRGEFCIVLEGNTSGEVEEEQDTYWTGMMLTEHVDYIIEETKMNSKEAIKEVAKLRGISKRDVYNEYHQ